MGSIAWVIELDVKPGKLDDFTTLMSEMVDATKGEDGALGYEWFISDDGSKVHIIERYADPAATMVHLANFGKGFAKRFMDAVSIERWHVYGDATEDVHKAVEPMGATFLAPFGGFLR